MKAAIFDMDGTLVDSEALAFGAAEDGLREYYARRKLAPAIPTRAELRALVGLPSLEYFGRLVPPERRGDAAEIRALVAGRESERLKAGQGRLYAGAWETLVALRERGWKLGLVSNCGRAYFDANLTHLRLGERFDVAYCLDDHPTKTENVRRALARLACASGLMIGDRAADLEAGRANGLKTVGCAYGFGGPGELAAADCRIASPSDLLAIV
jgi:phosphoglycolate phosphatase